MVSISSVVEGGKENIIEHGGPITMLHSQFSMSGYVWGEVHVDTQV